MVAHLIPVQKAARSSRAVLIFFRFFFFFLNLVISFNRGSWGTNQWCEINLFILLTPRVNKHVLFVSWLTPLSTLEVEGGIATTLARTTKCMHACVVI